MNEQSPSPAGEPSADAKLDHLRQILRSLGRVCVAYSGGVDSAFLLAVAADTLGAENVLAGTGVSPSLPARERAEAEALARRLGCEYAEVQTTELNDAGYSANSPLRCYYCKSDLYRHLESLCRQRGFDTIVNGANADDAGDFRPGHRAADEFRVRSPILQAGLTKAEVRLLSARMGLPTADKPAMACLASRLPYGTVVTAAALAMIEQAEDYLWNLGLRGFRVRHHVLPAADGGGTAFQAASQGEKRVAPSAMARIELPDERIAEFAQPDKRADLLARFKAIGYVYVTLDLQGFRSGSGNEVLPEIGRQR